MLMNKKNDGEIEWIDYGKTNSNDPQSRSP